MRSADREKDPGSPVALSPETFREQIYRYYARHARDFSWRRDITPYRIVVSEVMLQQTQVERVSTAFPRFIRRFPDFPSLSGAPLGEVLAEWQGLGYNRRAIALKKTAEKVGAEFSGELPCDERILETFPGIGKATAASIIVFAFNIPVPFIETNIRRVFLHCFFPGAEEVPDREIIPLVRETMDRTDPRTWFWALMDYGAHIGRTRGNPNRRSSHYRRQPAFHGSDRQMRGAILRILVKEGGMERAHLCTLAGGDAGRVTDLLKDLESEGFIEIREHMVSISRK
ncbi:A/G-specific adenine glycosylase [Methanolinea mesophila]|uniref:A/G-specific adenine glycosylase n=1 Tax=Methanolinea mesophila TaxID=547055 RepID=UPI001AE4695D|nr:A/G-specific adenine glycosylase [Methanolinea mesophila]